MTERTVEHQNGDQVQVVSSFETDWRMRRIVQPILICVSVVSLFTGLLAVSRSLGSSQLWMRLVWLFALVALEGIFTTIWLNRPNRHNVDRIAYRIAELLVILLLVRVFTWTVSGTWPQIRWLRNYLLTPTILASDSLFVVGSFLATLAWLRAISLSQLFAKLAIDQAEASYYALPANSREPGNRPLPVDRGQLVTSFFQQWLVGAFILIICTAVTTFNLSDLAVDDLQNTIERVSLQPDMLTALLIYFLSGFFLLGHARLAALNARWLIGGTSKSRRVERSWHRANMWLITIVAFLAAFLPLGSTLGASHILEAIIGIIYVLFNTLLGLFIALLSLLFPRTASSTVSERARALPQGQPSSLTQAEPNPFVAMVFSSLFWAIAIFVTIVAVSFFLRDRGVSINRQLIQQVWQAIITWFRTLWQDVSYQAGSIRQSLRRLGKQELGSVPTPKLDRWRLIRINALSPRDQLRYFYLSTVRRAGEQGVKRHRSETPLEYAQDMKDSWPQAEQEVDLLTDAFLKARYSLDEIAKTEANVVRQVWKKMKSALLRRGHHQNPSTDPAGSTTDTSAS